MGKPAIFWDRDDTLIADPGYLSDPAGVRLLPGAAEAVRRLAEAGYENIIVTNQSGVARGLLTEAALREIHDRLCVLFAEAGAAIDAVYTCPYLPGEEAVVEQYRRDSDLRKPKPGMLLKASLERKINLAASWSIGDALRDVQAGRAAGTRTILLCRDGRDAPEAKEANSHPAVDFVADSLEQAVEIVLRHTPAARRPAGAGATAAEESAAALQEILALLKRVDRRMQSEDFSLSRLAGTVLQIAALAAFCWSVFAWVFAPDDLLGHHIVHLLMASFIQLLALTFFIVAGRSR